MLPLASVFNVVVGAAAFFGGAVVAAHQEPDTRALLMASAGWVDVSRQRHSAAELGLGYRSGARLWAFRPAAGLAVTTSEAVFGWAGIAYDLRIGRLTLTPSFAPGLYRAGQGVDLGYPLEFRSQLDVGCRVGGRSRISVGFSHMSNAGLGSTNPGVETLTLGYAFAFGR
jgi:lipid A 3-O-deacylase